MEKRPSKIIQYLLPSVGDILWMAAFFGVLVFGRQMMNGDGDLGRHLTLGRYILETGKIPMQDVFSHTLAGQPLTPHEWLVQVIFALADRLLGLSGVILVCALVVAFAFWLVYRSVRTQGSMLFSALLVTLLAMTSSMVHWLTRPHLFTFLLLATWLLGLCLLRHGNGHGWWILPVLMMLWANLHGAFIAGFMSWFLYGIGVGWDALWHRIPGDSPLPPHFWRTYLLVGGTSFGATLLNPAGFGLWQTSVGYLGSRYLVDITLEYQSPDFHSFAYLPFLIYVGLLLLVLGLRRKKTDSGLLFTSAAWLLMGLYSARNIPLFAITAAPLLCQGIEDLFSQAAQRFPIIQRVILKDAQFRGIDRLLKGSVWKGLSVVVTVVVLASGLQFDPTQKGYGFDQAKFPVEAVDWLEENPQEGEMFNYFTWGGYMLYRQYPQARVFIDGQTDFYGEAFTRQYVQVMGLQEGWETVLDQYMVDWAILPRNEMAARAIQSELGWQAVYSDETTIILKRE